MMDADGDTVNEEQQKEEQQQELAADVKEEPQEVEMKGYAEDTMNELLGIYGYDGVDKSMTENLHLHHFASEDQEKNNPGSSDAPVKRKEEESTAEIKTSTERSSPDKQPGASSSEGQIVCDWCKSTGSKRYTLNTAKASQAFCSEKCFAARRQSYFTVRGAHCAQCQNVRPSGEMLRVPQDGVILNYCNKNCAKLYSMENPRPESDTKIKKMLQRRYANEVQKNSGGEKGDEGASANSQRNRSTPEKGISSHKDNCRKGKEVSQKSFTVDNLLRLSPSQDSSIDSAADDAQSDSTGEKHLSFIDENKNESIPSTTGNLNRKAKLDTKENTRTPVLSHVEESPHSSPGRKNTSASVWPRVSSEGTFLPPPTVMIPYPVFIPVPCPIPVPIPVSAEALKLAQRAANTSPAPEQSTAVPQPKTVSEDIPNRHNLFPSAFCPVTRTTLPDSVPGNGPGLSGYLPLGALPPEGVFHQGSLFPNFLPLPGQSGLSRYVSLRGLQRSASMDLPVCSMADRPSGSHSGPSRPHTKVSPLATSHHAPGSSTQGCNEPKELSKTVKEALRSHLSRRFSQSALNLTEVGRFPDGSTDDLRRSHSLSRLPVRGMESVPEDEPSTSYGSPGGKRGMTQVHWSSSTENGTVHPKRRREHGYLE